MIDLGQVTIFIVIYFFISNKNYIFNSPSHYMTKENKIIEKNITGNETARNHWYYVVYLLLLNIIRDYKANFLLSDYFHYCLSYLWAISNT